MASVTLTGVRKRYGEEGSAVEVIRGVDLAVRDGEFMVFVGPSGCGKSTLLRMIAGLESISAGTLRIGERDATDLPPVERGVAMVFQSYALYPHMTVEENLGFGLRIAGRGKDDIRRLVGETAEVLQISALLSRRPKDLSGGQRQRVAIGRAIVRRPGVFLFDEPLSNLDANLRVQMRLELMRLHRELGTTMIYVTHDQVEAMTMGERIAVFQGGRVEQVGAPMALYEQPANAFVARFLGSPRMNLLPAAQAPSAGMAALQCAGYPPIVVPPALASVAARCAQVGVRPESLQPCAPGQGWPMTVEMTEQLGDTTLVHGRGPAGGELLCAKLARPRAPVAPGETLHVAPASGALHLFDAEGQRLGAL